MLIFYLAILLVLLGILFLIVSLSFAGKVSGRSEKQEQPVVVDRNDIVTEKAVKDHKNGITADFVQQEDGRAIEERNENAVLNNAADEYFCSGVTLYEDRDSVVLPGETMTVDYSGIGRFKSLKRIASGNFSVNKSAISLKDQGRFFRYDTRKVKKVIYAGSSILVYTEVLAFPLLFVSSDAGFSSNVETFFTGNK